MIVFIEMLFFIGIVTLIFIFIKKLLFKNNNNNHIIKNSTITQHQWDEAYQSLPLLKGLSVEEDKTLKELCILFIHNKTFEGAQGFEITPKVLLVISLQACLPILKLGLNCYKNFSTIIVYRAGFKTNRKVTDENGIVDYDRTHLLGESWLSGPIILSWYDTETAGKIDGSNLVIHEFAHKLDMQNGVANGFPPLHRGLKLNDWVREFTKAFEYFERKCDGNDLHGIDCYAATSPAEFFSVFSEVFFERPDRIKKHFPEIHILLELYYRQTPISRLS
jgi:Mlc titration factor MtfA (ptsG expression regulator)